MKIKLLKDLPGLKAGTIGELNNLTQLVEFNVANGLPSCYYQSFRIEFVKDHPDFFEIIEEKREPKAGEVWISPFSLTCKNFKEKPILFLADDYAYNIEDNIFTEFNGFTESARFLAPSLEEYYRMKFNENKK